MAGSLLSQQPSGLLPLIVGHRGAAHDAPENTIASVRSGWNQNADAVEIDVYLTPDQRIVVIHDSNTKRVSGKSYDVSLTNSDVLRSLDVGSWKNKIFANEKIPFLEEVLETIPDGKLLFIEIKCGPEIIPVLKPTLEKSGKISRCVLISFQMEALTEAKKVMPEVKMYFLSGKVTHEELPALLNLLNENHLDGLDINYLSITTEIAEICGQHKIPLAAWTVDNLESAKRLIDLGVFAITTNNPGEFVKILKPKQ
jgi:glycerophosphoryl diester phosphodiesterase